MVETTEKDLEIIHIWENENTVLQIENRGSDYKVVMFSLGEEGLKLVEVAFYNEPKKILRLIKILKLCPTKKHLVLRSSLNG